MSKLRNKGYDKGFRETVDVLFGDGLAKELVHIALLYSSKSYREGYFDGCDAGDEYVSAQFRAKFEALVPNAFFSQPWIDSFKTEMPL
jgi:hypothetical protein